MKVVCTFQSLFFFSPFQKWRRGSNLNEDGVRGSLDLHPLELLGGLAAAQLELFYEAGDLLEAVQIRVLPACGVTNLEERGALEYDDLVCLTSHTELLQPTFKNSHVCFYEFATGEIISEARVGKMGFGWKKERKTHE